MSDARDRGSARHSKSARLATAATFVGLLAGLAALFDWFEDKTTDPPPATIDARLVSAMLQQTKRPLDEYLTDTGQSKVAYSRRELRERGLVFDVRVRLRGHEGDKMGLRWRMFTSGGRGLPPDIYSQRAAWFTPANQDHARTVPFWAPYPPRPGSYFVRFSLLDGKRQPLDVRNARFEVRDVPELD